MTEEFIKKLKIKALDSNEFFSSNLKNLEWNEIKKLSVLTGKNGIGKSKILKLIISDFNDRENTNSEKLIQLNDSDNFSYKDFEVKLIHFDGNLTDLKNESYYDPTGENLNWETNFTIENTFTHLKKKLTYSFPYSSKKKEDDFTKINNILAISIDNMIENELYKVNCELNSSYKILLENQKIKLENSNNNNENWLETLEKIKTNIDVNVLAKLRKLTENGIDLNQDNRNELNLNIINNKIKEFNCSFRVSKESIMNLLIKKSDELYDFTFDELKIEEKAVLLDILFDTNHDKKIEDMRTGIIGQCKKIIDEKKIRDLIKNVGNYSSYCGFDIENENTNNISFFYQKENTETKEMIELGNFDMKKLRYLEFIISLCNDQKKYELITTKLNDEVLKEINNKLILKKQFHYFKKYYDKYIKFEEINTLYLINTQENLFTFRNGDIEITSDKLKQVKIWFNWLWLNRLKYEWLDKYVIQESTGLNVMLDTIVNELTNILNSNENSIRIEVNFINLCEEIYLKNKYPISVDVNISNTDLSNLAEDIIGSEFLEKYANNSDFNRGKNAFEEICALKELKDQKELFMKQGGQTEETFLENLKSILKKKMDENKNGNFDKDERTKPAFLNIVSFKLEKEYRFENIKSPQMSKSLSITELTTGEQIILLCILWEYQANALKKKNRKLILLLDEPDCFLNPFSINKFIEHLKRLTNETSNVQVLLTSHNPGTVSLMSPDSIFYLEDTCGSLAITNCTKDFTKIKIIEGITDHLFFVLNPYNLVFVEGLYDHIFYKIIYEKTVKNKKIDIRSEFIGMGSNQFKFCFKTDAKVISEGVHNYLFGIIDGDSYIDNNDAIKYIISTKQELNKLKENNKDAIDAYGNIPENILLNIIRKETKSFSSQLFRLKRRHIENYLYDPLNIFFLVQDLLNVEIPEMNNMEETKTTCSKIFKTNNKKEIIASCSKIIFGDITIKQINKFWSENIKTKISTICQKIIDNFTKKMKLSKSGDRIKVGYDIYDENNEIESMELYYDSSLLYANFKEHGKKIYQDLKLDSFLKNDGIEKPSTITETYCNGKILKYYELNKTSEILFYNKVVPVDLQHISFFQQKKKTRKLFV